MRLWGHQILLSYYNVAVSDLFKKHIYNKTTSLLHCWGWGTVQHCTYCSEQIIQENWIIKTLYHFQGQIYWACLDVCGWKQRLIVFFTVVLHFCMPLSVFPVSYWVLKGFCQINTSRKDCMSWFSNCAWTCWKCCC